jgi:S-adenosylmethionine hydrolase
MFASSPHPVKNALVAYYLAADKFGNCIVNLTKKEFYEFTQNRNFEIMVNYTDSVYRISENFMEEQSATLIAYFNAADYLVIAYTMGHAERLFGLNKTEKIFINIK